jgi:hypothetical protein
MRGRSFNKLIQLLETVSPNINEFPPGAQSMEEDHEVEMAESQINQIVRNAERIREMLKTLSPNDDIEAWIQSKLTLADDYLVSVARAMANDFKEVDFSMYSEQKK